MQTHMKGRGLLLALTLIAALGGLLFGYDTAVISGAVGAIDANFIDPRGLSETAASTLSGWAISIALLGCVVGAAIAGPISVRFGRKGGLIIAAVFFTVSGIGSAYPEIGLAPIGEMGVDALTPFMAYRLIGGLGIGMASMLAPLYIAEISPPAIRGHMVTYQQIAIVLGITLVYFVNYLIALQGDVQWVNEIGWRYMLLSEAVPAALFLVLLFFVPDTPRWLVMRDREDEARAVLRRIADEGEVESTIEEIKDSLVVRTRPLFSYGAGVILIGMFLSIFQQFVGINAVLYYAPLMFENAGASGNIAFLQTVIVGVVMTLFTIVALVTVDKLGRKPLLIWGALVMAASMLALGALFQLGAFGVVSLLMVLVYIAGFSFSWGPVVWVLLAEIYPNSIKGHAMAIGVATQWIANFVVSVTFKIMDGSSALNATFNHGFAYYLYGLMSVLAAWFVWRFVPETKGRTLEAVEELWRPRAHGAVKPA